MQQRCNVTGIGGTAHGLLLIVILLTGPYFLTAHRHLVVAHDKKAAVWLTYDYVTNRSTCLSFRG